ncbi:MAG: response regulator transcription factor [Halieaceae bacterium]|nr:response regulator transcription factor [Halieaceae bacterium]
MQPALLTSPKTALVIEDHEDARRWLVESLHTSFPGIGVFEAGSVCTAMEIARVNQPDLALIDLNLPDGSGLEVIRELASSVPSCARIVATAFSDEEHIFAALRAGAQGYVLKEGQQETIVKMLQDTLHGAPPLSAAVARKILSQFQPAEESEVRLTPRQVEVLQLISRGYKTQEVADLLQLSPHTVHDYIKDIYRELGINSRAEATMVASRMGLISRDCN